MRTTRWRGAAVAFLTASVLGACGTPDAVREGARISAAQIAVLDGEMRAFIAREQRDQEARKAAIAEAMISRARLRDITEFGTVTAPDDDLHSDLMAYTERSLARRVQRAAARQDLEAWLAGLTDDLQRPAPAIRKLQTKLAQLSDERDLRELAEFYVDYAKESYDVYRDLEDEDEDEEAEEGDGEAAGSE